MSAPIPNILADRYASQAMQDIWSATGRIVLEREFWIAVMKAQRGLGLSIPAEAIAAYEKVKDQVNLDSIREREAITKHDVKARIEEFNELAGWEHIHKGMTSRDLTENVEQLQVWRSLELVATKAAASLLAFAKRAEEYKGLVITGRTHNVAAQTTTFGKRLAMFGEDMLRAIENHEQTMRQYAARGLKGAVGTQLDQLNLFEQNASQVSRLEDEVVKHLGIPQSLSNVGQVYPRSMDFEVVSALYQLGAGPSSFAKTLRLMAGHELAGEGFLPGQVGSSAMPHKMNSRSCERINGFHVILRGYMEMAAGLAGDQWNEGDVSCSVVRRVMLPDAFFAIDGLFETLLTVLNNMGANPAMIEQENRRYLPFLLTTTVLMAAVKNGVGRETAHEVIKEHAVATAKDLRSCVISENDLFDRLGKDERLGLSPEYLKHILTTAGQATGAAHPQVETFMKQARGWGERYPKAKDLQPGKIL
ncbi:adenylosuccinate lyase [Cerasicoccus fimbriatus]|uniref:adenylosuccinate lyase n=1 Tax=Cerasicoccus fimbriatus TaxID=3014554 RepID=UPI0022B45296|nr:adenylosuccinate lyase [Cerasicoccus sp. TK19100]